ncbi:Cna B-type domain-containing protein [Eggerthella sinensis]|uniref:Cna B-type domain-containing protein n=1 Tax=Eggerthella sinensis TaxID=242230 RepID=UPI0022DEE97A|nr:Cna B-type domain-containing protein [Eggerthella sinensis]
MDITYNMITDLSFLEHDPSVEADKTWLEGGSTEAGMPNKHNVTWQLEGNPYTRLPSTLYFGGKLVVKQAATDYSSYPDDTMGSWRFVRTGTALAGDLHVGRVAYDGATGHFAPLDRSTMHDRAATPDTLSLALPDADEDSEFWEQDATYDNDTVGFSGVVRSGRHEIAIGTTKIFNYTTQDRKGTLTAGGQSYKYYLEPTFYVFDKVSLSQNAFEGAAELVKTAEDGTTPLKGAEYSLFKKGSDAPERIGLVTDADGKLLVENLAGGDWYLQETKAPEGYTINPDPVAFTIDAPQARLGGGLAALDNLDNSADLVAGENEAYINGAVYDEELNASGASPDITLTLADAAHAEDVDKVEVAYAALMDAAGTTTENVVRTFDTLQEAQDDVNAEKNAFETDGTAAVDAGGHIVGPVSIAVSFKQNPAAATVQVSQKDAAEPAPTSVSGTKTWVDNDDWAGVRPEVTIHLMRDGVDTGKTAILPESSPSKETADSKGIAHVPNNSSVGYTFADLEKYDPADGHEYKYSVTEDTVTITYTDPDNPDVTNEDSYIPSFSGSSITNTWPDGTLVNIKGQKQWAGDWDDKHSTRPAVVTVQLWQNDVVPGGTPYSEYHAIAADGWKYHFDLVPKFSDKDETTPYAYYITEVPVEGYAVAPQISVDTKDVGDKEDSVGNNITNTYDNAVVSVSGEKTWADDDDKDGKRPASITVNLLRNGAQLDAKTVTEADGWKYTFADLDKYDAAGDEYAYIVSETAVPGYTTVVDGTNITNTYVPVAPPVPPAEPALTSVSGTKTWVDADDKAGKRPGSITMNLLRNNVKIADVEVTAHDGWKYTFANLDAHDPDGKPYAYTVDEAVVPPNYKKTVSGFDITNTLTVTDVPPASTAPHGKKTPPTGDAAPVAALAVLLAGAGMAAAFAARRQRR